MVWAVEWFQPMSGTVGGMVPAQAGTPWAVQLNAAATATITVPKDQVRGVPAVWRSQWSGGMVISHDDHVVLLGVIDEEPDEDLHTISFHLADVRAILDRRFVMSRYYLPHEAAAMAASEVAYSGLSLGSIAWRLVENATQRPFGALPIVHGSPDELTGHQRTYPGAELQHNSIGKRISEISGVIDGPDIMFVGERVDAGLARWVMIHGSENEPQLPQVREPVVFDQSAAHAAQLTALGVKSDGSRVAQRVYASAPAPQTSDGTTGEPLWAIAETPGQPGVPLIERHVSSQSETLALLQRDARMAALAGQQPTRQLSLTVRMDDPARPYGTGWQVGDACEVQVSGWLSIPDGVHARRIVAARGQIGSELVTVDFQEV